MIRTHWLVCLCLGIALSAGLSLKAAALKEGEFEEDPKARKLWLEQIRYYPMKGQPAGAMQRALDFSRKNSTARTAARGLALQAIAAGPWQPRGPQPLHYTYSNFQEDNSGRVRTVAVNPANPNHWLAGTEGGGLWASLDAGANWSPKTDDQASLVSGSVAFAPSNPSIIYYGCGDAGLGGLLKSTDSGETWTHVSTQIFVPDNVGAGGQIVIRDLRIHPSNPDILEVALGSSERGVYKSLDGGVTWSRKLAGWASSLVVDPGNYNRQMAHIGFQAEGGPLEGIYRSLNAGETWQAVSGPWTGIPEQLFNGQIAVAPSQPSTAYVTLEERGTGQSLGTWRTDNAWAPVPIWTQLPVVPQIEKTAEDIIVDPADANVIYQGGFAAANALPHLFRFNGAVWFEVANANLHVDQIAFAYAGNRLVIGNDGGIFSTVDNAQTFTSHNATLGTLQFYKGSLHPTNPNAMLGGMQDHGVASTTGDPRWVLHLGGDGYESAFSTSQPDSHWAMETQGYSIARTLDGGASFSIQEGFGESVSPSFFNPFDKHPAIDDLFIVGTDRIWKSTDFFSAPSANWLVNSPFAAGSATISDVAFAPSDLLGNTYAFGTGIGQLAMTTVGGGASPANWRDLDPFNQVPGRAVTGLMFHPSNANVAYVTVSGFDEGTPGQPGHIFKTLNALSPSPTWVNLAGTANLPHTSVALDLNNPDHVYVGTEIGLWFSSNGGATWGHVGPESGIPNVSVRDIRSSPSGAVAAFTYGRGVFRLMTNAPSTPTRTVSATSTRTPVVTSTRTRTVSATSTRTPVVTSTRTRTVSATATRTPVVTSTRTPLITASPSPLPNTSRLNLQVWNPGESGQESKLAVRITNFSGQPVALNRLSVKVWFRDNSGQALVPAAFANNQTVFTSAGGFVGNVAAPGVGFQAVNPLRDCGANRTANQVATVSFTDLSLAIPAGGGFVETGPGSALASWHHANFSNFDRSLDYSRITDAGSTSATRSNLIHYTLYLDGLQVCEVLDAPGTPDPLTGQEPCGISACGVAATPSVTAAASPNTTATATPTGTPTGTRTGTATATRTRTSSPTAMASPAGTATRTRTSSPTATAGSAGTATRTRTVSPTGTASRTRTPSPTATVSPAGTATRTRTVSPTGTASRTRTPSPTATAGSAGTATRTRTASPTRTRTVSPTGTPSRTSTPALLVTASPTPLPNTSRLNLQVWNPGQSTQETKLAVRITNFSGQPVALNRLSVKVWFRDNSGQASVPATFANNQTVFTSAGGFVGNVAATGVAFQAINPVRDCGANRTANQVATVSFTDLSLAIPAGGGFVETGPGSSLATWHHANFSNFDRTLDYSRITDAGGTSATRSNLIHYTLYLDGLQVCEVLDAPGTPDPLSGQEPCGISACSGQSLFSAGEGVELAGSVKTPGGRADDKSGRRSSLRVAPNPTRDRILVSFSLENGGNVQLRISDLTGREVKRWDLGTMGQGDHETRLDVADLAGGVYFMSLGLGSGARAHSTFKFAIQR